MYPVASALFTDLHMWQFRLNFVDRCGFWRKVGTTANCPHRRVSQYAGFGRVSIFASAIETYALRSWSLEYNLILVIYWYKNILCDSIEYNTSSDDERVTSSCVFAIYISPVLRQRSADDEHVPPQLWMVGAVSQIITGKGLHESKIMKWTRFLLLV